MKILLVEDNYDKFPIIKNCLVNFEYAEFTKVISVNDALSEVSRNLFDLMIIDIQIPDINGGEINPHGGVDLLKSIENLTHSKIPRYIFGLSSHHSDVIKYRDDFRKFGWPLFDINNDSHLWQDLIITKANSIVNNINYLNADIAIITALEDTELEELLKLNEKHSTHNINGYKYFFYKIKASTGITLKVVSASAEKMGVTWSSQTATRIIENFKPKMIFMSGICAGVKGKADLGDIIVGDPVWDWGAGKISENDEGEVVFLPEPHQLNINRRLRERFRELAQNSTFFKELALSWRENDTTTPPRLKVAPMACGSSVISTQITIDDIAGTHRKVTAIEMESYAIMAVAASYEIPCAVIKSVCDLGDINKSDNIQNYCAYTSASVVMKFITEYGSDIIQKKSP